MDISNIIETNYSSTVSLEHRKKYAQFFTPAEVADIMTEWLLGNKALSDVLEPAFGLGIFSRILLSKKPSLSITGYDIDNIIYEEALRVFEGSRCIKLILEDYINNDNNWEEKYDGIICNPPYFKFHNYDNKGVISKVNQKLNFKLNFHTNLYALFLLKSINQLKENGRCAYIIPSEFLNSDYGVNVKKYLIQSKKLRHIIAFNFKENVFDDALTTSAIVLCANDEFTDTITFSHINDIAELKKIKQIISSYPHNHYSDFSYNSNNIHVDIKWKNYYSPTNVPQFKNLVPFATYAKVMRGIATGANEYFSFNLSKLKSSGIDMANMQPCICHSTDVCGLCFTSDDFNTLLNNNKNVYILNPINKQDKKLNIYISKGEEKKINERYLTSKRTPWYSMEKRAPSPIWVNVFNREGLRFVRNETPTMNLTTFHCIYVNNNLFGVDADLLFAYLISNTAKMLFSISGREYGNGLNKFEPNDLNKSLMLDIGSLNEVEKDRLRTIYRQNRKNNNLSYIHEIDSILIDSFSN